jgi:ABC-2 type transport system permease protein
LLAAFADEKENRTIEILATSASPGQIAGGKVLGIVAIGLILVAVWSAVVVLGVFAAGRARIGWFQDLEMDWTIVLAAAAIALPAYMLAAALMTAIGASVPSAQEGQWLSALFIALHIAPFYLGWAILNHPHSPAAVALSLLPFTSLTTVALRSLFTVVPAGQVAAAVFIQALCAGGAIWLAGRALRLGMLRYGQRLSWHRLFKAGNRP